MAHDMTLGQIQEKKENTKYFIKLQNKAAILLHNLRNTNHLQLRNIQNYSIDLQPALMPILTRPKQQLLIIIVTDSSMVMN